MYFLPSRQRTHRHEFCHSGESVRFAMRIPFLSVKYDTLTIEVCPALCLIVIQLFLY